MAVTKRAGVYKDLMEIGWFKRLMKWRGLQFTLQAIGLAFFGVIIYAGLFGTPKGINNIGSTITWLIWWALIPVTMLVAARGWCLACPWIAPANWLQRLAFWRKGKRTLSLNLKVPKFMRNFGLMLVLFLILHWANSNFDLAERPETTVYLALGLFSLAIVVSLVFEKNSFCRYVCPVGAIIAPYSLSAPIELRNKDAEVCRNCKTRDCVKGNERGYACPMMIFPYAIDRNTHCILCTECVKTCPNDNISINIRRPFLDIFKEGLGFLRTRDVSLSLSVISVVLLGAIPFHNLEMTSVYGSLSASLTGGLGVNETVLQTVLFLMTGVIAVFIFLGCSWLARRGGGDSQYGTKRIFIWFALAFIPLAISSHVAHNYFHLLEEGAIIIPNLSDPFGFGWNLFGTAGASVTLLSPTIINNLQFLTIGFVFLASGYAMYRLSLNMFSRQGQAFRIMSPMLILLTGIASFYIWVLSIPMNTRF